MACVVFCFFCCVAMFLLFCCNAWGTRVGHDSPMLASFFFPFCQLLVAMGEAHMLYDTSVFACPCSLGELSMTCSALALALCALRVHSLAREDRFVLKSIYVQQESYAVCRDVPFTANKRKGFQ